MNKIKFFKSLHILLGFMAAAHWLSSKGSINGFKKKPKPQPTINPKKINTSIYRNTNTKQERC